MLQIRVESVLSMYFILESLSSDPVGMDDYACP